MWDINYIPSVFITGDPTEVDNLVKNVPKTTLSAKFTFIGSEDVQVFNVSRMHAQAISVYTYGCIQLELYLRHPRCRQEAQQCQTKLAVESARGSIHRQPKLHQNPPHGRGPDSDAREALC